MQQAERDHCLEANARVLGNAGDQRSQLRWPGVGGSLLVNRGHTAWEMLMVSEASFVFRSTSHSLHKTWFPLIFRLQPISQLVEKGSQPAKLASLTVNMSPAPCSHFQAPAAFCHHKDQQSQHGWSASPHHPICCKLGRSGVIAWRRLQGADK